MFEKNILDIRSISTAKSFFIVNFQRNMNLLMQKVGEIIGYSFSENLTVGESPKNQ